MKIRFIGDVHGKFADYNELIQVPHPTIQVGDMGIGFGREHMLQMTMKDRFINGNHDDPHLCRTHPNFLPPATPWNGVFEVGGGYSIDKAYRIPGVDWWSDEELSYTELERVIEAYEFRKPDIVVSHEAPAFLARSLVQAIGSRVIFPPSRTARALDAMYAKHAPKFWAFGHWHTSWRAIVGGTQFVCLDILQSYDVDLADYA